MAKYLIFTSIFLFLLNFSFSQNNEKIFIWPNKVPGEVNEKRPASISEDTTGSTSRLSEVTNPVLEVFMPKNDNSNHKAIIVNPGGAYKRLSIDKEGYEIANWLITLEYTVYVLQYRIPDKQDGALQDIQRSIRIVKSKGFEQVGIMGFSAGGSLCARAATHFNERTYTNQDQLDTIPCRPDFAILIYPAYLDKGLNRTLTPELTITNQTPPFFIFCTADDKYSNSCLVMTTALRDNQIPVEMHLLPFGGHGYGLRKGNIAAETWPALLYEWLKNYKF